MRGLLQRRGVKPGWLLVAIDDTRVTRQPHAEGMKRLRKPKMQAGGGEAQQLRWRAATREEAAAVAEYMLNDDAAEPAPSAPAKRPRTRDRLAMARMQDKLLRQDSMDRAQGKPAPAPGRPPVQAVAGERELAARVLPELPLFFARPRPASHPHTAQTHAHARRHNNITEGGRPGAAAARAQDIEPRPQLAGFWGRPASSARQRNGAHKRNTHNQKRKGLFLSFSKR